MMAAAGKAPSATPTLKPVTGAVASDLSSPSRYWPASAPSETPSGDRADDRLRRRQDDRGAPRLSFGKRLRHEASLPRPSPRSFRGHAVEHRVHQLRLVVLEERLGDVDIFGDDHRDRHVVALHDLEDAGAQDGAHRRIQPRQRPVVLSAWPITGSTVFWFSTTPDTMERNHDASALR